MGRVLYVTLTARLFLNWPFLFPGPPAGHTLCPRREGPPGGTEGGTALFANS